MSQGQPVSQGQVGTYDAGPMRRAAPGTCVTWGGSITGTSYASPFEHCG